jgi:hypothetical protein
VLDIVILGVAVEEHDMKRGLQERVGLTEAGLLFDTLGVRDDDRGIPDLVPLGDTDGDTLFDA